MEDIVFLVGFNECLTFNPPHIPIPYSAPRPAELPTGTAPTSYGFGHTIAQEAQPRKRKMKSGPQDRGRTWKIIRNEEPDWGDSSDSDDADEASEDITNITEREIIREQEEILRRDFNADTLEYAAKATPTLCGRVVHPWQAIINRDNPVECVPCTTGSRTAELMLQYVHAP